MRAIVSFVVFLMALWFIYYLMGIFKVVEQLWVGIATLGAFLVVLIVIFIWHLVTNKPTRDTRFRISTNPKTHRNLGNRYVELPSLPDNLTWWRGTIYIESEIPIIVKDLNLLIKGKRFTAYNFKTLELHGAQDVDWRFYSFAIPSVIEFGTQKAEIIAITDKDDYGSGDIILRG